MADCKLVEGRQADHTLAVLVEVVVAMGKNRAQKRQVVCKVHKYRQ